MAANLAAALQTRRGKSVLLVDADTVTGHVTTSLAMEGVRTVVDSWTDEAEGGPPETLAEVSSLHPSGMRVVPLTSSPLDTEILDPARVRAEVAAARTSFDVIVVDLHPSYSALNQAIFEEADRILVPVTPDVPAIRAAVQLRDVAAASGLPGAVGDGRQPRQQWCDRRRHGADRRHAGSRIDPLGRPAVRPRRERGPNRHRHVPEGEDQHRLRGARRPRPRQSHDRSGGARPAISVTRPIWPAKATI